MRALSRCFFLSFTDPYPCDALKKKAEEGNLRQNIQNYGRLPFWYKRLNTSDRTGPTLRNDVGGDSRRHHSCQPMFSTIPLLQLQSWPYTASCLPAPQNRNQTQYNITNAHQHTMTVHVTSAAQWRQILSSSSVVITDCMFNITKAPTQFLDPSFWWRTADE